MSKSDKMYKKSPKIEKDEHGKPKIKTDETKDEVKGDETPEPEKHVDVQEQERLDMAKRHVTEMKDMHKRHGEEFEKMHARHAMARGSEADKTGEDLINKVEETK